ncbi:unnamed protein product [Diamesa hyperborea]
MSWLNKAEGFLNKLDQSAANVLQQKSEENYPITVKHQEINETRITTTTIPKIASSKNVMILKTSTPKKPAKNGSEHDFSMDRQTNGSDTASRRSSVSSKLDISTVIDKSEDQKSTTSQSQPFQRLVTSSSNASLNSFSVEKELSATKIVLSELRSERDELKLELEAVMDQLKNNNNQMKLNELEDLCTNMMEEKENMVKISQSLELSNVNYVKSISELETTIMKLQQNENDLKQKLDYSKNETNHAANELQQYRLRAQTTLQMKEKIIEQLKSGQSDKTGVNDDNNDGYDSALAIELEQLKNERDNLQTELNSLNQRMEESRTFIDKMDHKRRLNESEADDKMKTLEETATNLTMKCSHYEEEIRLQKQEIKQIRDEMFKQKTTLSQKLHEKETEFNRLKNSYREVDHQSDIENRLQSMTQSLIMKQDSLETVTAERNSMKLHLEKLSHQHEELLLQTRRQRPHIINLSSNDTDDVKSQVPGFMKENPFDTRISRKVKRAYSSLDSVGVRLGVFLRRYPLARIIAICYVALLHFFVILVLFSSTPS